MRLEAVKAWAPIIASVLALCGTITVAVLQTKSAPQAELKALINNLNENIIPKLEENINSIRERLAVLEAYKTLVIKQFTEIRPDMKYPGASLAIKKEKDIKIPKIDLRQSE